MLQRRAFLGLSLVGGVLSVSPALADGGRPTRVIEIPRSFQLRDDGLWESRGRLIDRLWSESGVEFARWEDVLGDLNRRAHPRSGSLRLFVDSEKRKRQRFAFSAGFTWDREDSRTTSWYPQGITGTGSATTTGTRHGRRALLVSWYARKNAHKGARVSLVDLSHPRRIRYRHILLVEPVQSAGRASFRPVQIHAGGIALYEDLLYVVDTEYGIRVFDTTKIFRTRADASKSRVGMSGGSAYGFDYRYALPMVGYYKQSARQAMRFSFVSLDRTKVPHSLWVGEYAQSTGEGYGANFPLDPASGRLASNASHQTTSSTAVRLNRMRTQGFVAAHGNYFLNHTYARDPHRLHVQTPQGYASLEAPYGLEDLHYDPTLDRLWFLTEHPRSRAVYYHTAPDELR